VPLPASKRRQGRSSARHPTAPDQPPATVSEPGLGPAGGGAEPSLEVSLGGELLVAPQPREIPPLDDGGENPEDDDTGPVDLGEGPAGAVAPTRGHQPEEALKPVSVCEPPDYPRWAPARYIEHQYGIAASTLRRWAARRTSPLPSRPGPQGMLYDVAEAVRRDHARREAGVPLGAPPGARPGGGPGGAARRGSVAGAGGAVVQAGDVPGSGVGGPPQDEPSAISTVLAQVELTEAETRRLDADNRRLEAVARREAALARLEDQRIAAHRRRQRHQACEDEAPGGDGAAWWQRHLLEVEQLNERGAALTDQAELLARDHLTALVRRGVIAESLVPSLARDVAHDLGLRCSAMCFDLDGFSRLLDEVGQALDAYVRDHLDWVLEGRGLLPRSTRRRP